MNSKTDIKLRQSLRDAGCGEELMRRCDAINSENNRSELLCLLAEYRAGLLESVHERQDKLECLDLLIYQLKKSIKETKKDEI